MTQPRDKISLGKLLRKHREAGGWALRTIAAILRSDYGISCTATNLAKIERGEYQCKAVILAALCLAYDVTSDEVLYTKRNDSQEKETTKKTKRP